VSRDWLEYFHIELDAHDVIFAEGAPAETYVDCDNRGMFQNGADYALLYPGDEPPHWQFCAPRLEWDSEELTPIRAGLLERAAALTAARDSDPVLHLVADGKTTKETAALLRLSVRTIDAHRASIMRRLGIHDTAGLVRYAIRQGLIVP